MFHSHSGIIILASDYEPVSPVCFHFDQISAASLIQRRNCWNQGSSGGSTTSILLQRLKDNCWYKRLPPPTSAHMITFLIAEAVGTSSGVCVWWWCLGVSPWRYRSFHFYFLLLPWVFRPHSWVFGFRTAGPSYDARPDSAGLPAQPPAPCCPPETPAAPPEPPGSCRHTENKSNQNRVETEWVRVWKTCWEKFINSCTSLFVNFWLNHWPSSAGTGVMWWKVCTFNIVYIIKKSVLYEREHF